MNIECLIQRAGGSVVDMESPYRQYHFKPSDIDSRHIALVDVEHHAKALLRIKEGYRAVDDDAEFGQDDDNDRHLNGSTVHNASYTIKGGDTIALSDLVDMAFDDSGLAEEEWNALDDNDRYAYIDTTLKELVDGEHGEGTEQTTQIQADQSTTESSDPVGQSAQIDTAADTTENQDTSVSTESADVNDSPVNANSISENLADLKGEALIAAYEKKFGRKPSSKMKVDDIRRALSEDDD
jgi:hypothetical protein